MCVLQVWPIQQRMQGGPHYAHGQVMAAAARRRTTTFASRREAMQRLRTKPGFRDFTDVAFDAYLDHDLEEQKGAYSAHLTYEADALMRWLDTQ